MISSGVGTLYAFHTEAQRAPIFTEMAKIVSGDKTAADAVQEVIDATAE